MDPETKAILSQTLELSKQNNLMLQQIVRAQKIAKIYRMVYWGIIILFTLGSYIFLQPYLGNLLSVYTGTALEDPSATAGKSADAQPTTQQQLQDLVNALK
jgi:hypothetical protein